MHNHAKHVIQRSTEVVFIMDFFSRAAQNSKFCGNVSYLLNFLRREYNLTPSRRAQGQKSPRGSTRIVVFQLRGYPWPVNPNQGELANADPSAL